MAIAANIIVLWPGTNASIPSGWSRETALDAKFPKGTADATNPGGTGGALTHTHTTQNHNHAGNHTHTVSNTTGATGTTARDPGATHAAIGHTHVSNPNAGNPTATLANDNPSTDGINNEPPYFKSILIKSNGSPAGIPVNAVALWNTTTAPANWNLCDGGSGRPDMRGTFIKGADASGDGGGTGGATTHTGHTIGSHSHGGNYSHNHPDVTSSATATSAVGAVGGGGQAATATQGHQHVLNIATQGTAAITGSTDSVGSGANEPPYVLEGFIQNNTGGDDLPVGIIVLWIQTLATIPSGWNLCDGTLSTPDLRGQYVKGATTLAGVGGTGGSLSHGHTATGHTHPVASHSHTITQNAGAGSNINAGSTNCATTAHTHDSGWASTGAASLTSGSGTPTVDNQTDTQPPFYTVAFLQKAQDVSSWSYTGSGGPTIGGAAGLTKDKDFLASGGPTIGGAGVVAKDKVFEASGGATIGGAATTSFSAGGTSYEYAATGGVTISGAAEISKDKVFAASGGVTVAGGALLAKEKAYTALGGASVTGSAAVEKGKVFNASGGVSISGAAEISKDKTYSASGGPSISGAAVTTFGGAGSYPYVGSGGVTIAGAADVAKDKVVTALGGVTIGGAAATSFETAPAQSYTYQGTGGVVIAGTALLEKDKVFLATGGATVGGVATTTFTPGVVVAVKVSLQSPLTEKVAFVSQPSPDIELTGATVEDGVELTSRIDA